MRMDWFKTYSSALDDKVLMNLRPEIFKFWFRLRCMANDQPIRGTIACRETVALRLGMQRDRVSRFVEELLAVGILEEVESGGQPITGQASGNGLAEVWQRTDRGLTEDRQRTDKALRFRDWDDTQAAKSCSTERVRDYRKRINDKRQSLERPTYQDTQETPMGVSGTPLDRDRERDKEESSSTARVHAREGDQPKNSEMESSIAADAIAAARAEFGDQIGDMMDLNALDISSSLGGRWDCYLAAVRKVKRGKNPIADMHSYALRIAQRYAAVGIPAEPVPHVPSGMNGSVPVDPKREEIRMADLASFEDGVIAERESRKRRNFGRACI